MYEPEYTITEKILNKCMEIGRIIDKTHISESYRTRLRLRKESNIISINSSLAIEGINYSLEETQDIINGKTVRGPKKEIRAIQNAYNLYSTMENLDPFSKNEFIESQIKMMSGVLDDKECGTRNVSVGVFDGNSNTWAYRAPEPKIAMKMLDSLFDWYYHTDVHPLVSSAIMHFQIEHIHPFIDGNGRMGRLWHSLILSKYDSLFLRTPIESMIRKNQNEYYRVLDVCHKTNCTKFIEFSLEILIDALNEASRYGSDDNVCRLTSMMNDSEYTVKELLWLMGLKDQSSFVKFYLKPAIEQGVIEMTIPDKPRSKNQHYRLVNRKD